uniref:Uncharacterized protein n=1 Tax=uncultured bacterium contig00005 TaxID=1181497 RepID=A0A806JZB5_9BACT|nr:hypothetical protein [uncultured bacterium contig00005]
MVPAEAVEVFDHDCAHAPRLDFLDGFKPPGAVPPRARVTVVDDVRVRREPVAFRVVLEEFPLVLYGVGCAVVLAVL